MSDRFSITKSDGLWWLTFPVGFDAYGRTGQAFDTFTHACAAFAHESAKQCPDCLRGAVVDTDYGWKCEACGNWDVAVCCEVPK